MIAVTGATGKLGQHVVRGLLARVPAGQIIAGVRDIHKAEALRKLGVQVRQIDYTQPQTLRPALQGVDRLLLISSNEVGRRFGQHQAVVDAAKAEGVKLLAYTSMLRADTSTMMLASEHLKTEEYIRGSGVPFVLLRNGWYFENHTEALGPVLKTGVIPGAAGSGKFASASRADYAEAAVAVLAGDGHQGRTYELAGDEPYTLSQLAAEVTKLAARPIVYHNLSQTEFENALVGWGLPAPLARVLADADAGAEKGELDGSTDDLRTLIGRRSTPLSVAIEAAL